jgi:hypothetical protein
MKELYDYDVGLEWSMFWHNGWENGEVHRYDKDCNQIDEREYLNRVCAGYKHDVKAVWLASLSLCGDIGVGWIEAKRAEDGMEGKEYFANCDLEEIESAIAITERMLLRQGIPFTADYKFTHDKGKRMKRLNLAIRKRLKVDEYVERLRKRAEEKRAKEMEEWEKEHKEKEADK